MSVYWQYLLSVDADINVHDHEGLFQWFATRITQRDGVLNVEEALEATHAMAIMQRIIDVLPTTAGYACPGTRTWLGHNVVLGAGEISPYAFARLFKWINQDYVGSIPGNPYRPWEVLAAQTYDAAIREEPIFDAQGEPTGEVQTITTGVVYRPVPQSIGPWLARDLDAEGAEIAADPVLTASRLGSVMGTTPWVVEGT